MDPDDIEHLWNPPTTIPDEFEDKHFLKALKAFLAATNASEATYNNFHAGIMEYYPDNPFLTFGQVLLQNSIRKHHQSSLSAQLVSVFCITHHSVVGLVIRWLTNGHLDYNMHIHWYK